MKTKFFTYIFLATIFAIIATIGVFAAVTKFTESKPGYEISDWFFIATGSGNAWTIDMTAAGVDGNLLTGSIELQSIGKGTFSGKIIPPNGKNPTRTCWTLNGVIETKNAGNISLTGSETNLRYNPVTRHLEGHGYNHNLGKVWLGMGKYCQDEIVDDNEIKALKGDNSGSGNDSLRLAKTQSAFIGRVKIIGNIGDNNTIFGEIYEAQRWVNMARYTQILQEIRKNVAILSRNISTAHQHSNFDTATELNNNIFYINNSSRLKTLKLSSIPDNIRSIIVVGGDVVIENDIHENSSHPRAIVVLENSQNIGGNIFIKENVKKIHASLVAEKSLLSGDGIEIYNDTPGEIATPKKNQLYINGTLFSRNTIGGASKDVNNPVCPYNSLCSVTDAQKYDLNYFRLFDVHDGEDKRAIDNFDDYSVIIEYDSRVISNPPPVLDFLR